ncbi:MAG: PKD domain-containing protein [Bacteroidetes bacterium]|nr:MAG: PKD domain-containing protein [Bacteroidota bacterium]
MRRFVILFPFLFIIQLQAQIARIEGKNLFSFSGTEKKVSTELLELSKEYQSHPDFGVMPYQIPPEKNCFELLSKRDAYTRYFVKSGSGGSHFFKQQAYSPINYLDKKGNWREINYRLTPDVNNNQIFTASNQPTPIVLNLDKRFSTIEFNGKILSFNHDLKLVHVDDEGKETILGTADWSHFTAGDDGLKIIDFYPGIDAVFTLSTGTIETSFILKSKLLLSNGYLVMRQNFEFPDSMRFLSIPGSEYGEHIDLYVGSTDHSPHFTIEKCYAYDNSSTPQRKELRSRITNEKTLDVFTSVSWLNDPSTVYPVVIDPVVTTQNSLAAGSITGTRFSPVCWTNSCDYFLTVPTPANTTITNIYTSFEYFATGACFAQDGGFSVDFASCKYPSAAPGVITCAFAISNFNCGVLNATTLPDFTSCLPSPQCAPQNLDFTLHFYRCNNDPAIVCGNSCIRASQPWMMTIEGRTMEMIYNSPTQIICAGDSVNVITITQFGVPPYQNVWSPIAPNNDTIRVSPASTTNYTVTVTDACGTVATGSSTVQVTPYNNPGFTISPNPACIGQAVTLLGLGSGPVSSYDWTMPGSNAPGGVITNSKSPIIQYGIPAVYPITLRYTSNSCVFDSTLNIVIDGASATDVSLSSSPPGAICPGDSIRFLASPVNGGSAPVYDWYIDGILVQSGASDTLKSNAFINGSLVQVVLTSNSPCSNPQVDTAALFVVFSNAVSPGVSISPDTTICPGSTVTFNASPLNGGASPAYRWYVNGLPVPGANASTFSSAITANDSLVSVEMISSLGCVISAIAFDSTRILFEPQITPVVSLTALPAGAVCAGDSISYTALAGGGGLSPSYQWYLNGVASGVPTSNSSFVVQNPVNGDSVSVSLNSSHTCLLSNNAQSWTVITVTSAASPSVNLSVSPSLNLCAGDTAYFRASATAAGSIPIYRWYINGILQPATDSVFNVHTLNDQDLVWVEVVSSLSCAILPSDSDSVIVNVSPVANPSVTISNSANGTCVGDTISWTATAANGGTTPSFQWTVNGVLQGMNAATFSYMPQDGDQIKVSLTSNSPCALVPTAQSNIFTVDLKPYVTPSVSIHASPSDTICPGQNVTITSQSQNGGTSPVYIWRVNGIVTGTNSSSLPASNYANSDQIQLSFTSNAECLTRQDTLSNIIRIITYQPINVQVNGTGNNCPGTPVMLSVQVSGGDGGPYTYFWDHSPELTDTVIVRPKVTGDFVVHVQDNCASTIATGTIRIPVLSGPTSALTYSPDEVSSLNNTVAFQNLSQNAVSWLWDFGDSTFSSQLNPEHTYDSIGTYQVMLITQSVNGCTDTLRYNIVVKEDISVFFPSAFSPNGDFQNETWQPMGVSLIDYSYTIWDRWGQLIFEGDQSIAWDGHIQRGHTPAQNGVYLYRVDLKQEKFGEKVIVGRLTLIR